MQPGIKVVCVDGKFDPCLKKFYTAFPTEGKTYVIRGVTAAVGPRGDAGHIAVYLVGIVNPRSEAAPHPERGFNSIRFRPLEEIQAENRAKQGEGELVPVRQFPIEKKDLTPAPLHA